MRNSFTLIRVKGEDSIYLQITKAIMKMIQCSPDLESETREDTSPRVQDQYKIVICMALVSSPIKKVQVFITLVKNKEF